MTEAVAGALYLIVVVFFAALGTWLTAWVGRTLNLVSVCDPHRVSCVVFQAWTVWSQFWLVVVLPLSLLGLLIWAIWYKL